MKILFVAEVGSIHSARWVNQLHGTGWDYRIFQPASYGYYFRREFLSGHFYTPYDVQGAEHLNHVKIEHTVAATPPKLLLRILYKYLGRLKMSRKSPETIHTAALARLLNEWKPDVIHSLGMFVNWRHNSKIVLDAREMLGGKLPCPWIVSTWGPDLDLYPYIGENERKQAESVMTTCDGILIEGERDAALARNLGFRGRILAKLPAFGGITWNKNDYCAPIPSSNRRIILLKGRDNTDPVYEGGDPQGRAMTAIRAFEMCHEFLKPFSIVITQATPTVERQAGILAQKYGLDITTFPNTSGMPYEQWLKLLGSARMMIAVTASDGLPSTLVEAMSLGVFPIHSDLETVKEWVRDGDNGLLVPPDDVQAVYQALRRALSEDSLVDRAADFNVKLIKEHLSADVVRPQVIELYKTMVVVSSKPS